MIPAGSKAGTAVTDKSASEILQWASKIADTTTAINQSRSAVILRTSGHANYHALMHAPGQPFSGVGFKRSPALESAANWITIYGAFIRHGITAEAIQNELKRLGLLTNDTVREVGLLQRRDTKQSTGIFFLRLLITESQRAMHILRRSDIRMFGSPVNFQLAREKAWEEE